jgi:tetratricopeptide (TPR) repeat protein
MRLVFAAATLAASVAAAAEAPKLPRLDVSALPRGVREPVAEAYRRAETPPPSAAAVGELGMILHAYEQYDSARACYAQARALDPGSFDWAYLAGLVASQLGERDEAVLSFGDALRVRPGSLPARLRLADVLRAKGDLAGSRALYEAILAGEPGSPQAQYGLGRVEAARGRLEAAVERYQRAIVLFDAFGAADYALGLAYRDLGRAAEAQAQLARYEQHRLDGPPLPDPLADRLRLLKGGALDHLAEGVRAGKAGDVARALAEHVKALEIDPRLVQAHANLISLHGRMRQWDRAEEHYRAAVALDSGLPEAHYDYGVVLVQQGRTAEAADAFRRALEMNPYFANAHNNLGTMLEAAGEVEAAAAHYRSAVDNDPGHRLARFNLGRTLVALGRAREAVTELEKTLVPQDADTPRYMFALAAACVRAGDLERARGYAQEARRLAEALGQAELAAAIARDLAALGPPP